METEKIKIIIVDDEKKLIEFLKDFLEDYDISVKIDFTGNSALESVMAEKFDVAIVDMRLPDMTGDEFILKSNKIQPDLKYFVHTGSLEYALSSELMAIGLDEESIIFKPIRDLKTVYDAIMKRMGRTVAD